MYGVEASNQNKGGIISGMQATRRSGNKINFLAESRCIFAPNRQRRSLIDTFLSRRSPFKKVHGYNDNLGGHDSSVLCHNFNSRLRLDYYFSLRRAALL